MYYQFKYQQLHMSAKTAVIKLEILATNNHNHNHLATNNNHY